MIQDGKEDTGYVYTTLTTTPTPSTFWRQVCVEVASPFGTPCAQV